MASLVYRDDQGRPRSYVLPDARAITIGRGEDVDLRLGWDRSVSTVHAEALPARGRWLISDEGLSRNGTFVNGERLSGRRRLREGDLVRVGRTALTFHERRREREGSSTVTDALGATGTATLLFTDFVGSTELMDRLGDEAGDRARAAQLAILRRVALELGGEVVKSLGDGLMVAFASASGAAACAVGMQRQLAAYSEAGERGAMALRIGLNAGEVLSAEGDYYGTPVVVAKRLCDSAASGQTLCSDVVRALVGSRGGYRFEPRGPLHLKGIAEPVVAFELAWRAQDENLLAPERFYG